ncbi:MAG TPA: DnaB-like helicase C-terminal domain-containing protein, partial [Terriglobales bacterium]|nr:DnaB-like helicase C-terminal domain-containing protein [Terriglobales bacterium]
PDDVRVGDRLHDVLDGISQRAGGMRGEFAIPTGIAAYDEKVAHAGGKLIVVAGPPSHGKTALGGGWAAAAAIDGYPTLVFSLEMTAEELIHRFLARESGVAASDMATGAVSYADFKGPIYAAAEKLRAPELYVVTEDDTFARVRARIRRWYARRVSPTARKLGLVVVDYLQLVAGEEGSKTREREIGQMSRGFKRLAVELNVPIVLLSQLSRAYAQRDESEPPKLSDLRDSGQIEQDADIVVFPWRRPYEGDDGSKLWNDDCPADLIVAKNRGGRRGKVPAKWHAKATTFRDMERADREPVRNWQDGREED